ncbi:MULTISPECIES: ATP-binding protein [Chromobacterium]|uniref:ATP-binding protein n=1 Tax=Chromobacterium TaxID=535 RepID=UPI00188760DA|nr:MULTISPECIES: ATP-binding protein [Chromobacterium]QOZ83349.1 HAMP domain-containing protein [Chromobacterium sp. Rain0013]WON83454.1 ATP-binding protein [Chromobacterium haemolyticum]
MRWLPRTLYGQILLTLVGGLLLANALGIYFILSDRDRLSNSLRVQYTAQHIADIVNLLDECPSKYREQVISALNQPTLLVRMDRFWERPENPLSLHGRSFQQLIKRDLIKPYPLQVLSKQQDSSAGGRAALIEKVGGLGLKNFTPTRDAGVGGSIVSEELTALGPLAEFKTHLATVQARLSDGTVLTFNASRPISLADQPIRILAWLLLVALTAAILGAWAVRQLIRPLDLFARAARGLASNLNQAPLPETGSEEVAEAARTFNRMQTELQRLLKTRNQMLAGVSHDLRLPITRIRLRLEGLAESSEKQAIERDLLEMDQLINDSLTYLRGGCGSEGVVNLNLNALLESVVEDMEAFGADIQLHSEPVAPVAGKVGALRRCLGNLLENARRYGGTAIEVSLRQREDWVEVRIQDQGPGIAEADLERVMEPYVRLEDSRARHTGGSGLGLAIARAIARDHGGDLKLNNRPQGGLCVQLTLPAGH